MIRAPTSQPNFFSIMVFPPKNPKQPIDETFRRAPAMVGLLPGLAGGQTGIEVLLERWVACHIIERHISAAMDHVFWPQLLLLFFGFRESIHGSVPVLSP